MRRRRRSCNGAWHYLLFQVAIYYVILPLVACSAAEVVVNVKTSSPSSSSLGPTRLRNGEAGGMESGVSWTKLEEDDEANSFFEQFDTLLSVYHFMGTCTLHEYGALHRELSILLPAVGFHDETSEKTIVLTYLPENMKFTLTPFVEGRAGDDGVMIQNQTTPTLGCQNAGIVVKALNIPQEVWDVSTFLGKCHPFTYLRVLDFSRQYAMDHPMYQPFSVLKVKKLLLPSSTPDDFVWSTLNEMTNTFGLVFRPVLPPKKVQIVLYTYAESPILSNDASEEVSHFYKSLGACLSQQSFISLKTMKDLVTKAYKYECLKDKMYLPVVPTNSRNNNTNTQYRKIQLMEPIIEHIIVAKHIHKQEIERQKFGRGDILAGCLVLAIVVVGTMRAVLIKTGCCCCFRRHNLRKEYSQLDLNQSSPKEIDDGGGIEFRSVKQQRGGLHSAEPGLHHIESSDLASPHGEAIANTLESPDVFSF